MIITFYSADHSVKTNTSQTTQTNQCDPSPTNGSNNGAQCETTQEKILETMQTLLTHVQAQDLRFNELSSNFECIRLQPVFKLYAIPEQYQHVTAELKQIKEAMRSGDNTLPAVQLITFTCKKFLPLKSITELYAFEDTLSDPAILEDFTTFVMSIGGSNEEKLIAAAASAVYALELQIATTWKGKKSPDGWAKHPLDTTKLPYIIADVARTSYPHRTTAEFIRMFRMYMLHASDRAKKHNLLWQVSDNRNGANE